MQHPIISGVIGDVAIGHPGKPVSYISIDGLPSRSGLWPGSHRNLRLAVDSPRQNRFTTYGNSKVTSQVVGDAPRFPIRVSHVIKLGDPGHRVGCSHYNTAPLVGP